MYGGSKRGGYSGGVGGGGSQSKKPKNDDDDDFPETFEDQLAGMEEDDMMESDFNIPEGDGPALESTYIKWTRPSPPVLDPKTDKICFQQVELDHYIGRARNDMPGANQVS